MRTYTSSSMPFPPFFTPSINPTSKFKLGDKVIGNKGASQYGVTGPGTTGVVISVFNDKEIEIISDVDRSKYFVQSNDFDLLGSSSSSSKVNLGENKISLDTVIISEEKKEQIKAAISQIGQEETF